MSLDGIRKTFSPIIPSVVQEQVAQAVEAAKPLAPALQDGFDPAAAGTGQAAPVGMADPSKYETVPASYPMKGDATLEKVANGEMELASGAKGESVRKLQEALELAGQPLPKHGADSDFGTETKDALADFQSKNDLEPTGRLDAATIKKLDAAAAANVKKPQYDKLYEDSVLNTTIGIGYDEKKAHLPQIKKTIDGLEAKGYQQLDVTTATDDELTKHGIDPATVDKTATYFVKDFQHQGKDVKGVVKLITPDTPNAKEKFARAMNEDELVMYSGHGRVGSGPDFDPKDNPAGNYVIGAPHEENYVKLGENDLKKAKMTNDYQLMFFDGCNTNRYVDDLRSIPKNKNSKNLDIVGANTELSWSTSSADVLTMLDGVEKGKSMNEITSDLNRINKEHPRDTQKHFMTDGFEDND
ncbi:MAG: peptidoglycan-binding protein [Myxococcaceae bacterium]|nr:peptidoglycan-binding protein [Myxococcaceae bacterium]